MFDIARLIIAKGERYEVVFQTKRKEDGTVAQPLFFCQVDETVWLSRSRPSTTFWAGILTPFTRRKNRDRPPKGTYTFVAQCGMSDEILGPPNYHGYQEKLRSLHAERFARLPFDVFKSRVKIVHDEEVVNKWIEEQSYKTEYIAINLPEEARLDSRDAVRSHFREHHLGNLIASVDSIALKGNVYTRKSPPRMQNLVRRAFDEQRRFPIKVVNMLSQEFSSHGLQFFKRKKSVTHVSVSRPHHLDLENTPVSESIRDIVSFIIDTENCTRRNVLEKFAPEPEAPEASGEGDEKGCAAFTRAHRCAERPALARASGSRHRVRQRPDGSGPQAATAAAEKEEAQTGEKEEAPPRKRPRPKRLRQSRKQRVRRRPPRPRLNRRPSQPRGRSSAWPSESTEPSERAPELETAEAEPAKEEAPAPAAE